jgi:hypothetical protein
MDRGSATQAGHENHKSPNLCHCHHLRLLMRPKMLLQCALHVRIHRVRYSGTNTGMACLPVISANFRHAEVRERIAAV